MMQNGLGESFWNAHGVEIGPCAIFDNLAVLPDPVKFAAAGKNMPDLMLGVIEQREGFSRAEPVDTICDLGVPPCQRQT